MEKIISLNKLLCKIVIRRNVSIFLILSLILAINMSSYAQGIAIGQLGAEPHASSILDLQSTQHGLLIPRMTTAQRGEIKSPAEGLLIYNTTSNKLDVYTGAEGWYSLESVSDGVATGSTAPGGGMSVNETGADPHDVAILDVSSTEKGFLLPRTEPTTVSVPTESLIIFNTISKRLTIYDGSDWTEVFHNAESTTTGTGTGSQTGMLISNTDDTQPHHSAMLELRSTNGKGLLVPRMTTAQRNALAPVQGLIIYNTETQTINYCTGTEWHKLHNGSWEECGDDITFTYNGTEVTYGTVESLGKCWLDRNLGASQVATESYDYSAFGDLFQWGRAADGHQLIIWTAWNERTSVNPTTEGECDAVDDNTPPHPNFIKCNSIPYDWREPKNNNLWQGIDGLNNPCPSGWRLPSNDEWNSERLSWAPNINATGAINSPLKLPQANFRKYSDGLYEVSDAAYWSYSVNDIYARAIFIRGSNSNTFNAQRASGFSVRCIKGCPVPIQPTQGTHISSKTEITWNWNVVEGADGYKYNTINEYYTATDNGASTTYIQTGLTCSTQYTIYVWAYSDCGNSSEITLTQTTVACCDGITAPSGYGVVESLGKCWLDRNIGASQVATSSTDHLSYGDLFQWGRAADGHQLINWTAWNAGTPVNPATAGACDAVGTNTPSHSNFIKCNSGNYDWRNPQNPSLWQGADGTNNPCPAGWRVPTFAEWNTERLSWAPNNNATGAINSPLKLPLAGLNHCINGSINLSGSRGYYWSSSVDGTYSRSLNFNSEAASIGSLLRAYGYSVRCIKD